MAYPRVWTLVTVLPLVVVVCGYGTGAPTLACSAMVPGHIGFSRQTSIPPFTVTVSQSNYTAGDTLTVTIKATGPKPLAGFLLQARLADSSKDQSVAHGVFTVIGNTQTITCFSTPGSALTHTDAFSHTFNTLAVQWTAPTPAPGHIEFRATIAIEKSTFWVDVKSAVLEDQNAAAIVTTPSTVQPTTTDTTPIDLTTCGTTKGCLRSPSGCAFSSCDTVLTWADTSTGYVNFEISRMGSGWVGIGLSTDRKMGGDSVMECLQDASGTMMVSQSKNVGRSNTEIPAPKDEGIDQVKVGYNNGFMICRFRRQKLVAGRTADIFDINTAYHLIIAQGNSYTSGSGVEITKHVATPFVTSTTQSFSRNTDSSITPTIPTNIKAHGCLMIVAWVVMSTFGITMARHFKRQWPDEKLCGKAIWFPLHVTAMVSTLLITIIAFIVIFVHINGYSQITASPAILTAHPVLGIIVTCLAIINPIMAAFRPAPDTKNRPLFNWGHWGVGTVARVMAVVTIFLGLSLPSVKLGKAVNAVYVMVGYVCFYALCEISIEIHRCISTSKETDGSELELKSPGSVSSPMPVSSSHSGQLFRNIMLGVLILGLLGFGLALVIMIAIS